MLNRKMLLGIFALVIVLAVVGGISWVLVNSNSPPSELSTQEEVRDDAMAYIEANHPETAPFMKDLSWTGGRATPTGLVGAETYTYLSLGWNITITYPVIPNPTYTINADYSATSTGDVSIPYRVIWQGTWENESIAEINYTFAQ